MYKAIEIKSDKLWPVPELIEDLTDADGTGDLTYCRIDWFEQQQLRSLQRAVVEPLQTELINAKVRVER